MPMARAAPVNARDESAVRPFVAFGGGIKMYRGTGEEQVVQPLSNIALLTKAQDLTGMLSIGAGFKVKLSPNVPAKRPANASAPRFARVDSAVKPRPTAVASNSKIDRMAVVRLMRSRRKAMM